MKSLAVAVLLVLAGPAAAATLIVGNKGEDTVSFIDLATAGERRVPTGAQPHEVAVSPDGRQAAVVAYGGTTIDIFDIGRAEPVRRIELAPNRRPHGIAWQRDGRIIATTEGSSTLTIVDAASGKVTAAIPTGQAGSHMLAVTADGGRAYVSNLSSRTVSVIDLAAGRKLVDLQAGAEPEGIALTPDGRELWVANRAGDDVAVFDTATLKPVATIAVGDMPIRLAISPDGRIAITSNHRAGTLTLIDVASRRVTRTIAVGAPGSLQVTILFDPAGRLLYVAETGLARVAEVELASGRVLRRLVAGTGSDGLGLSAVGGPAK